MSLLGLRNKQGRTASASCLWRVACNLGLFLSPCCSWTPGHPSHIPSSKPPSSHSPFVRCPSFSPASRGAQEGSLPCSARGSLEPGKARLVASMSTSSSRHHHLFDAHCHIQLGSTADEVDELIGGGRGSEGGNLSFGVMSTRPHDWPMVSSLCARHPGRAVAAYGLHPWWAHYAEGEDAWLADLRERVVVDATAIVGEIGLDKKWTAPPGWRTKDVGGDRVGAAVEGEEQVGDGWVYDTQVRAFQAQVRLATELGRPVSMHCVAAHGDVFEFLRGERELPPAMYMHSFGGKTGMAQNLIKMKKYGPRFYFGFSHFANSRSPKTREVVASIPDDRLLLESDLEYAGDVDTALRAMLACMAEAKGWTMEQAAEITARNAETFFTARPLASKHLNPELFPGGRKV